MYLLAAAPMSYESFDQSLLNVSVPIAHTLCRDYAHTRNLYLALNMSLDRFSLAVFIRNEEDQ